MWQLNTDQNLKLSMLDSYDTSNLSVIATAD